MTSSGGREPQWLTLGRIAAAKALYEVWNPTRTDNGFPDGSPPWAKLDRAARKRYLDAGEIACQSYQESTYASAREAIEAIRR